jgi:hypothetical protein
MLWFYLNMFSQIRTIVTAAASAQKAVNLPRITAITETAVLARHRARGAALVRSLHCLCAPENGPSINYYPHCTQSFMHKPAYNTTICPIRRGLELLHAPGRHGGFSQSV